jgi:hypothetical protein
MADESTGVEQSKEVETPQPLQPVSAALLGGFGVSRVIEFFPVPGGGTYKNCVWGGQEYSKGATYTDAKGRTYECSGDADGSWTLRG